MSSTDNLLRLLTDLSQDASVMADFEANAEQVMQTYGLESDDKDLVRNDHDAVVAMRGRLNPDNQAASIILIVVLARHFTCNPGETVKKGTFGTPTKGGTPPKGKTTPKRGKATKSGTRPAKGGATKSGRPAKSAPPPAKSARPTKRGKGGKGRKS